MTYVQLLAHIDEVNRPPGGKDSIRRIVQNTFLTRDSQVLDVGCNTGYSSFEILHLVKCFVTGVDISPDMIETANKFKDLDSYSENLKFVVGNGMSLPFLDETFDMTMSGGSTAFIDDKAAALNEYARVTKPWGFVADVNFYYKSSPPAHLLRELNESMGINIEPWEKEYWLNIYASCGLELYYTHYADVYVPTGEEVRTYCEQMTRDLFASDEAKSLVQHRLEKLMKLFAENHCYLAYGVFILRKRPAPEQVALFGT